MKNIHGVDLDLVFLNAEKEGIDLSQITLEYSGLTESEELELKRHNLVTHKTAVAVLARFNAEGVALFSEKVSAVIYLGA